MHTECWGFSVKGLSPENSTPQRCSALGLRSQVQELKEMTDRISYLETEGRELTRQLSTLEARIKAYQVNRISTAGVATKSGAATDEAATATVGIAAPAAAPC